MSSSCASGPMYNMVSAAAPHRDGTIPCWSASSEYNFWAAFTSNIHVQNWTLLWPAGLLQRIDSAWDVLWSDFGLKELGPLPTSSSSQLG